METHMIWWCVVYPGHDFEQTVRKTLTLSLNPKPSLKPVCSHCYFCFVNEHFHKKKKVKRKKNFLLIPLGKSTPYIIKHTYESH